MEDKKQLPTEESKTRNSAKLDTFIKCTYEVIDHVAV